MSLSSEVGKLYPLFQQLIPFCKMKPRAVRLIQEITLQLNILSEKAKFLDEMKILDEMKALSSFSAPEDSEGKTQ